MGRFSVADKGQPMSRKWDIPILAVLALIAWAVAMSSPLMFWEVVIWGVPALIGIGVIVLSRLIQGIIRAASRAKEDEGPEPPAQ